MLLNRIFYTLKPFIPRRVQIFLRRQIVFYKRKKYANTWPIDPNSGKPPQAWAGWPGQKQFALVLTHDVDTKKGYEKCLKLMDLEKRLGFQSSFNFVPERYEVSKQVRDNISRNAFEIGVHGLLHDGNLFKSKGIFQKRAARINHYLKDWEAVGFRSPAMHHNLEWIHMLNIKYDASTFDTDPFEPQPDGMKTIFPFWVQDNDGGKGYVEIPYTLPQDFTLFIIMREKDISIWKRKLDWIASKGGMALLNTHPDYMNFTGTNLGREEYLVGYYEEFLAYIKDKYQRQLWHVLPCEIARFWASLRSNNLYTKR